MSNVLQWRAALRAGNVLNAPAADGPFAPISPRDIAEVSKLALLAPAAHAGKIYALTGAEIVTLRDEIAILGRVLGRELICNAISPDAAAAAARAAGRPEAIVQALHYLWTSQAAGQAAIRTSTFAEVTGHPPETFETWAQAFAPSTFAAATSVPRAHG